MRVAQINGGAFGSTGKIMFGISNFLEQNGDESLCFSPVTTTNRNRQPENEYIKIGTFRSRQLNVLLSRITGYEGCFAYSSTRRMLKRISEFEPDVIHLHSIHSGFVNLPMLFRYIKTNKIKTVWTLHDCWSFTGHCPHFLITNCDKWKQGCENCPIYREYPESLFDNSKKMYRLKKKWFSDLTDCMIVTPSKWLADLAKQSFLNRYKIRVINNGIALSLFKPEKTDFKPKYGLVKKHIILGVAFGWGKKKGLDVFIKLSEALPNDYKIVLVGTDNSVENELPEDIIAIGRTQNQTQLAEIYSAADVFVNPTREDNFPTVNIEALACGTPVITFNTGGSAEIIDETSGSVIEKEDIKGLVREIERVVNDRPYTREACVKRAAEFDEKERFAEYIALYKEMLNE